MVRSVCHGTQFVMEQKSRYGTQGLFRTVFVRLCYNTFFHSTDEESVRRSNLSDSRSFEPEGLNNAVDRCYHCLGGSTAHHIKLFGTFAKSREPTSPKFHQY